MSSARLTPISRGSRTVPPSISGTPQRRQKTPSTASSSATRRSHHSASSSPPATACPAIAAITGLARRIRVGPIGPSPSSLDAVAVGAADRLEVGAGAERAALAVQHRDGRIRIGVEGAKRIGERRRGGAVDRVAALRAIEEHRGDRPRRASPGRASLTGRAAPTARRTKVRSGADDLLAAGRASEPAATAARRAPPRTPRRARRRSARHPAAAAHRRRSRRAGPRRSAPRSVRDRPGARHRRAGRPARRSAPTPVAGWPAPARANVASTVCSRAPVDREPAVASAAARIARSSRAHTKRNTSTNSSSLEAKWR